MNWDLKYEIKMLDVMCEWLKEDMVHIWELITSHKNPSNWGASFRDAEVIYWTKGEWLCGFASELESKSDDWLIHLFFVNRDGCHMWGRKCSLFPEHLISLP